MDIATLSCAALVRLDADRTHIREARFALGVAAPVPRGSSGGKTARGAGWRDWSAGWLPRRFGRPSP